MDTHKDHENEEAGVLGPGLPHSGVLKDGVGGYIEIERVRKLEEVKHEMDCLGGTCTITPLGYRLWHFFTPCVPCI